MFHKVLQGDWQVSAAILGWILFAMVFCISTLRALLMPAKRVKRLEAMPLERDSHE